MPHALLLSPDDQAVSAITGVLEEMSVTCERPLDGVSAAHKLNSQSFDLVLVDCENLPAAKLIFDVCRRGKNGNNPVPIAIVEGRAGLPTAFRLGAELSLTKPVAKDQARSTIRTAVSRVRQDAQTNESVPLQPASAPVPSPVITSAVMSEERAQAATASASSQLTSFADPAPSFVPSAAPGAALTATLRAPALTTKMHFVLDEIDATPAAPKLNPQSGPFSASSLSESSSARAVSLDSKPARPVKLSDDPVLALAGMAQPTPPAPSPANASDQVARATAPAPAPESPKGPEHTSSQTQSRTAKSATSSVSATAPVQPTATPGTAVASPTAAPVLTKLDASKPSDSKKDAAAATLSQLPGENSAII